LENTTTTAFYPARLTVDLEAETEAAQRLMHRLFVPPPSPPRGVEYSLAYRFAEAIGGDIGDVFDCGDDGVFVTLADLEGTGCEAAANAAVIKFGVRAYAAAHHRPSEIARELNRLYLRHCASEQVESFATLFLASLNIRRRTMTYVAAAHEYAMMLYPSGFLDMLQPTGPLVGLSDDDRTHFIERTVHVGEESVIIAVSDGITDATNGVEHFGISRLRRVLARTRGATLGFLTRAIIDAAVRFCDGKVTDDMAVLAVRFT
jgi:serine phosphatase RsbU (regulator of sigma subunit)